MFYIFFQTLNDRCNPQGQQGFAGTLLSMLLARSSSLRVSIYPRGMGPLLGTFIHIIQYHYEPPSRQGPIVNILLGACRNSRRGPFGICANKPRAQQTELDAQFYNPNHGPLAWAPWTEAHTSKPIRRTKAQGLKLGTQTANLWLFGHIPYQRGTPIRCMDHSPF